MLMLFRNGIMNQAGVWKKCYPGQGYTVSEVGLNPSKIKVLSTL